MDGKSIVFDQASRNFMQLTSFSEAGSCPYLYSWDDRHNAWVRHGKVIHEANDKDKDRDEDLFGLPVEIPARRGGAGGLLHRVSEVVAT